MTKFLSMYLLKFFLVVDIGDCVLNIKGYKGSQQFLSGDSLVFTNMMGIIKNVLNVQNTEKLLFDSKKTIFCSTRIYFCYRSPILLDKLAFLIQTTITLFQDFLSWWICHLLVRHFQSILWKKREDFSVTGGIRVFLSAAKPSKYMDDIQPSFITLI